MKDAEQDSVAEQNLALESLTDRANRGYFCRVGRRGLAVQLPESNPYNKPAVRHSAEMEPRTVFRTRRKSP